MIARLRGNVIEKAADHTVVDVGGVGYRVFASLATLSRLPPVGEVVLLRIHTEVREDALELYGFIDATEEGVFHALTSIPSIGCRKATGILSSLSVDEILAAVRAGEPARLAKAHGVGKKTAERLVLELKDRLGALAAGGSAPGPEVRNLGLLEDLQSGLCNLGYKADQARRVAEEVLEEHGGEGELPALLRAAIARLR